MTREELELAEMPERQIQKIETEKLRNEIRAKIKGNIQDLVRREEVIAKEKEFMRFKKYDSTGFEDSEEEIV